MTAPLTPAEAATSARRHPVTIREALRAGELHGFQRVKGGRWLIHQACLDAWVENRKCDHQLQLASVRPLRRRSA